MAFKQYKISDLIKELEKQQREFGDLPVMLSVDEEGNEFNPIGNYISEKDGKKEITIPFSIENDKLVIWP